MYTDQLKYFSFAYRMRGFSAAAKEVPMTVQGLEKAIRVLETELGVSLFSHAESGALLPSPYADELIRFAEDWDLRYRALHESFARIRAQERHEIRLGVAQGIIGLLGLDFLSNFHREHAGISVIYDEVSDVVCDRALREKAVELALTVYPYGEDFTTIELAKVPVSLWVNTSDPLSKKEFLTFSDLEGHSLAMPGRGYKVFDYVMKQLAAESVCLTELHGIAELFRIFDFVREGKGVGYGGRMLGAVFSLSPDVATVPLKGTCFRFGLSRLPTHILTDYEQQFYDYCIRCASVKSAGV